MEQRWQRSQVYRSEGWAGLNARERGGLLLVAEGLKPAVSPIRDPTRTAPVAARLGLSLWPLGRRQAATTPVRAEELARGLTEARGAGNPAALDDAYGRFFGVPRCCRSAFSVAKAAGLPPQHTAFLAAAARGDAVSELLALVFAFYRPCGPECSASRRLGARWLATLRRDDPEAARALAGFGQRRLAQSAASVWRSAHARGAEPAAGPVRVAQVRDADSLALVDGVDELAIAEVDAVVAESCQVRVLEEHQVARLERVAADARPLSPLEIEISACCATYQTSPEQSEPLGNVPPHTHGEPLYCRAMAAVRWPSGPAGGASTAVVGLLGAVGWAPPAPRRGRRRTARWTSRRGRAFGSSGDSVGSTRRFAPMSSASGTPAPSASERSVAPGRSAYSASPAAGIRSSWSGRSSVGSASALAHSSVSSRSR